MYLLLLPMLLLQGTTSIDDGNNDGLPQQQRLGLAGQKRSGEPYDHQARAPPSRRCSYSGATAEEKGYEQATPTPAEAAAATTDMIPWDIACITNLDHHHHNHHHQLCDKSVG